MLIVLVVIYGMLQLAVRSSTEDVTLIEQIYAAFFLTIVFLWLLKHLYLKDIVVVFTEDWLCFFLGLFIFDLFLIVPLVGMSHGVSPIEAFRGIWRLGNLFLVFVILTEIKSEKQVFILFLFLIFLTTAQSGYDLFEGVITKEAFRQHMLKYRLQSIETPSVLFLAGSGLLLGLMIILGNRIMSWTMFIFCFAINLCRCLFCFSRTISMIFILMLIFFFFINNKFGLAGKRKGVWIKAMGIIVLSAVFLTSIENYFPGAVDVYRQRFAAVKRGMVNRGDEYRAALNAFRESPILGKGSGYNLRFYRTYTGYEVHKHVHNFLIWYLFIGGLAALGLLSTILYHYYRKSFGLLQRFREDKVCFGIVLGAMLGMTNFLLLGLTESTMQRHDTNYMIAVLIGMTLSLGRLRHRFKGSVL